MKRFTSVLIAVILGAFATGIGTVPFLVLANQDRHRLDQELNLTKTKAAETEAEKQHLAEEANQKVKLANEEVQKAQAVILEAQQDEQLLLTSEHLIPPSIRDRAKWNPAVSLSLGISLLVPKGYTVENDDPAEFVIGKEVMNTIGTGTIPVIYIEPFNEAKSIQYTNSFASSTDITYVAGEKLIKGREGILLDGSAALAFEVRSSAKSTHLIWMKDPEGSIATLKKILSTIQYQ